MEHESRDTTAVRGRMLRFIVVQNEVMLAEKPPFQCWQQVAALRHLRGLYAAALERSCSRPRRAKGELYLGRSFRTDVYRWSDRFLCNTQNHFGHARVRDCRYVAP